MSKADLNKGLALWQKITLGSLIFSVGAVGLIVLLVDTKKENDQQDIIRASSMPTDFFYSEAEPVKQDESIALLEKKQAAKERPKKRVKKYKKKTAAAPVKYIMTNRQGGAFINTEEHRRKLMIEKINKSRRGSVETKVAFGGGAFIKAADVDKNYANKWKNTERDEASYPVKLERTITVDRIIPAILINEILSDLGGKVVAQIEENIYGAHGRNVLIPAGSKAIGRYSPLKKAGEERLRLFWTRIITPQGVNINTTQAELTDTMGRSGLGGEVDKRFSERYGAAMLFSIISSAAAYSLPVDTVGQQIVIGNFSKDMANTTSKILDENINIKPRMTIPAGQRIFINPVRDIWFPKSKNKQIKVAALK